MGADTLPSFGSISDSAVSDTLMIAEATPASRTVSLYPEDRSAPVAAEARSASVAAENRTIALDAQPRTRIT